MTNKALEKHAGRFVWLLIDVDDTNNAGFLEKYPITALPSLLVIDPKAERVLLTWVGGATVAQLEQLFDDGEQTWKGTIRDPVVAALARADRLYGQGKYLEAADAYEQALHICAPDWSRRPRVVESLVTVLEAAGNRQACAEVAIREGASLPPGPSYANAVSLGLYCALSAPPESPWRQEALPQLEALLDKSLSMEGILADERSSHYYLLVEARRQAGDDAGMHAYAEAWVRFLETQRAQATTPEARAAFDSHLLTACLRIGDPARAIPALQQSERDLPGDYNPSARLAVAYEELGQFDDALAAVDRALSKVYGPRKLRVYRTKAEILEKMGRTDDAVATLEEALAFGQALPASQRRASTLEALIQARDRLRAGGH